jgi:mannose-1-phosphate guanylyltransferase
MCGGAGTRLWPASRENRPKQFLPPFGALSTFQETVRRVADLALFARPIVVTSGQYRFLVAEQLAAIRVEADILLEPARRDSGPAIAAGAGMSDACINKAIEVTNWPINQIQQVVQPDDQQLALLNDLASAIAQASDAIKSQCLTNIAFTPMERLAQM